MRLFLKIFLVFWLSNATVFAAAFAVYALWERDRWQLDEVRLRGAAEGAVARYESGGRAALRTTLRRLREELQLHAHLQSPDGRPLGRPVPPPLARLIGTELGDGEGRIPPWDNPVGHFAIEVLRVSGRRGGYRFVAFRERPKHRGGFAGRSVGGPLLWLLAIAVASGVIAWLLIRPLRQLQGATRRLAEGDLQARVPPRISRRRDALGDLGREFDRTAGRVQALVDSQRRLLRDVSHELRSPLARIQVALAMAEDRSSGGESELQRIGSELARLDALIGQVLALTRLDSGVDQLQVAELDLLALLEWVVDDACYEGAARGVSVRLAEHHWPALRADAERLHSALENVVRNAVRYTAEGSEVCIARAADAPPDRLCIQIRDRGPGVPAEDLPRLFDAFYRSGEARDAASGGHGVGLAIARSVLRAHGGEIRAENHPEGGLLVTLCLPLGEPDAAAGN